MRPWLAYSGDPFCSSYFSRLCRLFPALSKSLMSVVENETECHLKTKSVRNDLA
jgi:hypothetical protein